jgi:hypothetical protein
VSDCSPWEGVRERDITDCDLKQGRLPSALSLGSELRRVLWKCHGIRNLGEYEGDLNVDERIVTDLIAPCRVVAAKVGALPPIAKA